MSMQLYYVPQAKLYRIRWRENGYVQDIATAYETATEALEYAFYILGVRRLRVKHL